MLLKVDLPDGAYVADVGFGVCVLDFPLRFETDVEQRTAMGTYRLSEADGLFLLSATQSAGWRTMYAFTCSLKFNQTMRLATGSHPPVLSCRSQAC